MEPHLVDWLPRPAGAPRQSKPAKDQDHEECVLRGGVNKDNIEYYSVSISNTRNAKIFIKGALLFIPLHMQ